MKKGFPEGKAGWRRGERNPDRGKWGGGGGGDSEMSREKRGEKLVFVKILVERKEKKKKELKWGG